jgi:ribosomal protein L22
MCFKVMTGWLARPSSAVSWTIGRAGMTCQGNIAMASRLTNDPIYGEVPTFDAVRYAVQELMYQLGVLPAYWRIHADWLGRWYRESENVLSANQHRHLDELRRYLSRIRNHEKAGLSEEQLQGLMLALNRASVLERQYKAKIPDNSEAERRSLKKIKELLEQSESNARSRGELSQDDFRVLSEFAEKSLKGITRRMVELICEHAGACPLATLAVDPAIMWPPPYNLAFESRRRAINEKLISAKLPYEIRRRNNKAKAFYLVLK